MRLVPDLGAVEETVRLLRYWHSRLCAPDMYSTQPNPEALREMVR